MKDGLHIGKYGTEFWFFNGLRHRSDGPAMIYADGAQYWFINGKRKVNEYVTCSLCGASVNKKNIQVHENEKCHNRTSK